MEALYYLPIVIWLHILSLLPAKSLLIARSINKFFLNIINDPSFISFHIRNFPANLHETRMLTIRPCYRDPRDEYYSPSSSWKAYCQVLEMETEPTSWIEASPFFDDHKWFVAGSVNGILLMIKTNVAVLWNPCINKCRQIPSPLNSMSNFISDLGLMSLGLGYDDSCNDYKILAIDEATMNGVWVYSVRTRFWTKVGFRAGNDKRELSEIWSFKNGLVWIEGVDTEDRSYYHHFVRFDFVTKKFCYIPTPYPINRNVRVSNDNYWVSNKLVMIDGGCSMGVSGLDSDSLASIWVLDETAMLWSKVYNISEGVLQMRGYRYYDTMTEYWTKNPKLKISVNVENENKHRDVGATKYVGIYVESLVLLV